eukprot:TRINITY_DN12313_c2_g1_i4.p1 TRINITY_DN12313_c2_g1~~TRINITY_DN12313_c2_g1_i4.p1  ORF type:complete len:291 (-),score=23.81 TRINITY_DN12313_c2_g1_i4:118-990(-)
MIKLVVKMSKVYLCCCCDPDTAQNFSEMEDTEIEKQLGVPLISAKVLGSSPYSTVYRNIYKNKDVAVKVINQQMLQQISVIQRDDLTMDLEFAWRLDHTNLLQLYHFKIEHDGIIILTELMQYNLRYYIHEMHGDKSIQMYDIMRIIKSIASALDYLHRSNPLKEVAHGNLHPGNVLIDFNNTIKVSDFVINQQRIKHGLNSDNQKSPYSAPEILTGEGGTQSDIYSLGVVGWELWTRTVPNDNQNFIMEDAPQFYNQLIQNCLKMDRSKRPSALDVVQICDTALRDLMG